MANYFRISNTRNGNNILINLWKKYKDDLVPPLLGIGAFLLLWEIVSSFPGMRLPGPSSLFTDERTRTLLLYPFYDRGGLDKGLFWQTLASLGRVAQGYSPLL